MSEVYVAFHETLKREVALKVPRCAAAFGPAVAESWDMQLFAQARRLASASTLAGFVRVLDVGVDPARKLSYLLMELVDGKTLAELMRFRQSAFPVPDATRIVRTLAKSLAELHKPGALHGDVKPSNVMLSIHPMHGPELLLLDVAATSSWRSPLYLAPEGFGNAKPKPGEDVYALGLVFYELLAGRHPHASHQDTHALLGAHKNVEPTPIHEIATEVTPQLASIVARMIAKDPAVRYPTCGDVVEALDRCIGGLIRLPPLESVFELAPATVRAPTAVPKPPQPRLWTLHDGVDGDALAAVIERAKNVAAAGTWVRLVVVEGPRRLLGLRYVLAPGAASFGRAIERDVVVPHRSVGAAHGTLNVTPAGAVSIHVAPDRAVELNGEFVREAWVGPFAKLLVGSVCLQAYPPGAVLPVFPAVPDDLFEEEERLILLRADGFPLIEDLAATSPAPSRPMSLANAEKERWARMNCEGVEALVTVLRRDVSKIAAQLKVAHGFEAQARIRAGEEPSAVIRRAYGEDIDWMERARALVAATPPN